MRSIDDTPSDNNPSDPRKEKKRERKETERKGERSEEKMGGEDRLERKGKKRKKERMLQTGDIHKYARGQGPPKKLKPKIKGFGETREGSLAGEEMLERKGTGKEVEGERYEEKMGGEERLERKGKERKKEQMLQTGDIHKSATGQGPPKKLKPKMKGFAEKREGGLAGEEMLERKGSGKKVEGERNEEKMGGEETLERKGKERIKEQMLRTGDTHMSASG
jgi:hypothetical protein